MIFNEEEGEVLTATELIAAIATIVEIIALEALWNAMSTGALELIVATGGVTWFGITGFLIGVVTTIVLTITAPSSLHTLGVTAKELVRLTSTSLTAAMLIGLIRAVGYTIANVGLVNAFTIHASGLILATSCR